MLIYAHRGDHREHDENTIAAFEAAIVNGADGIETDLRHTADDRVAIFHDHAVRNIPVTELTLDELRHASGIAVPTLEDLLPLASQTAWNLEIKTYRAWHLATHTIRHWQGELLVTSFIHPIAEHAAQEGMTAGLLIAHRPTRRETWRPTRTLTTLVQDYKVADHQGAAGIRRAGWRYGLYGMVGEAEHADAIESLRPDIIITDDLDVARRAASRVGE